MKAIIRYLRSYFREEIRWPYLAAVLLILAGLLAADHVYNLTRTLVDVHARSSSFFLRTFLLYIIPFGGCILIYVIFYRKWQLLRQAEFIVLVLFTIAVYTFRCDISLHRELLSSIPDPKEKYYYTRIANQLVFGLVLFVFPLLWWLWKDKRSMRLYGWSAKKIDLRPYFIALLILVPLIALASTQKDFLRVYPTAGRFNFSNDPGWMAALKTIFYELCYGFDFVMNEFFFRGFIILAFARFMGRGIILPMTLFYVFIHLGKPMGETISSFFGGLILGVIAYETRSIYGGIILHLGLAWMMEIGGAIGRMFQ